MASCRDIEHLITAYVDDEAAAPERGVVENHVLTCPLCRRRVVAERATKELIRARAGALLCRAPLPLRARCAAVAARRPLIARVRAFALRHAVAASSAALVILTVAGAVVWGLLDQSGQALATQLTLDHLKCFATLGTVANVNPQKVQTEFESRYGMRMRVPAGSPVAHLALVGARRCFYTEGQIAHILYRHDGRPVSMFLLPHTVRRAQDLEIMGHRAVMWSRNGMTYVVVAPRRDGEAEQVARYIKTVTY